MSFLFIQVVSGVHIGDGEGGRLPREAETGWPVLPAKTLSGALKTPVEIGARLVTLPVRSLQGDVAWLLCPAVLQNLKEILKLEIEIPTLVPGQAMIPPDSPLVLDDAHIVLEDTDFKTVYLESPQLSGLGTHGLDAALASRFTSRWVLLADSDFNRFAKHLGTQARIRVQNQVRQGEAEIQEIIPAETVFVAPWKAVFPENPVRIGAGASTGLGWCLLKPAAGEVV